MRKLLLSSTALNIAAALTVGASVVDVSISAATEQSYSSRGFNVTTNDGTTFGQNSVIAFNFSNKSDIGLTIGYSVQLESYATISAPYIDESLLSILGGLVKQF